MEFNMLLRLSLMYTLVDCTLGRDLYLVSTSRILKIGNTTETIRHQPYGQIIGLAVDTHQQYLFWSEILDSSNSAVIYKSKLDGTSLKCIIEKDLGEVIGLAADWSSSHIYWTDTRRKMIEVADYNGTHRHVVVLKDVKLPRAIVVDPVSRYLYWGDQGTHAIHRSYLDGTGGNVFIKIHKSTFWPNQIVINYKDRQLYWADGWTGLIWSCDIDSGKGCRSHDNVSRLTGGASIFGVALEGDAIYTTALSDQKIYEAKGETTSVVHTVEHEGLLLYLLSVDPSTQPANESCNEESSCSHMCLWSYPQNKVKCHCPSYEGYLPVNETHCSNTVNKFLVYAEADSGYIGITSTEFDSPDVFILAMANLPVAVTYDPVGEMVYFSDVGERAIYRVNLDGSVLTQVLNWTNGVGIVEGMAIDVRQGLLYYTNRGMADSNVMYTWNRIDMVSISSLGSSHQPIRSVVTDVIKPRALHVDTANNKLHYSDLGTVARVRRCDLDGENMKQIERTFENPNGLFFEDEKLYIVDSLSNGTGKLYVMVEDEVNMLPIPSDSLKSPFGLTGNETFLYITDWKISAIMQYDIKHGVLSNRTLQAQTLIGIHLIDRSVSVSRDMGVCQSRTNRCDKDIGMCILGKSSKYATCLCPTNQNMVLQNHRVCRAPNKYLLFADQEGIKTVSLDSDSDKHVHLVIGSKSVNSNIVAVTYDEKGNHIYFSDADNQTIYKATPTGEKVETLVYLKHTVENLAVSESILYWTTRYGENGTDENSIYSYPLDQSKPKPTRLVTGLKKPRGIAIDKYRKIYWTESDAGQLRSASLTGHNVMTVTSLPSSYNWVNGISFDPINRQLYMGAASENTTASIFVCKISYGKRCIREDNIGIKHVFGVLSADRFLYMSNWETASIESYDFLKQQKEVVVSNLVRPTQIVMVNNDVVDIGEKFGDCSSAANNCHNISCINDWGCPGHQKCCQKHNCKQCVDPGGVCDGLNFINGQQYKPDTCQKCTCHNSQRNCTDIVCSNIVNCVEKVRLPDKCCHECRSFFACDEEPKFHHCPKALYFDLPPDSSNITVSEETNANLSKIYATSCANQRIDVEISETFHYLGIKEQLLSIEVEDVKGKNSSCGIVININDVDPPVFTYCPKSQKVITNDKTGVVVSWQSPQATDNSENVHVIIGHQSRKPREKFPEGTSKVIYYAGDRNGNAKDDIVCEFNVEVEVKDFPCSNPKQIFNGILECQNQPDGIFACSIKECHKTYEKNSTLDITYKCEDGKWTPEFPQLFRQQACFKPENPAFRLDFKFNLSEIHPKITEKNVLECFDYGNLCPEMKIGYGADYHLCADGYHTITLIPDEGMVIVTGSITTFSVNPDQREEVIRNLTDNMQQISNFFESEDFLELCTNLNGRYSPVEMDNKHVTFCPPGQYFWKEENRNDCVKCSIGTRFDYSTFECDLCPLSEYQDEEGQLTCKPCPSQHKTSTKGSYLTQDCEEIKQEQEAMTIAIIVSIAVGGTVAIVLIISMTVYYLYKLKHTFTKEADPYCSTNVIHGEESNLYKDLQGIYDIIPADIPDSIDDIACSTITHVNPIFEAKKPSSYKVSNPSDDDYLVPC